MPNVITLAVLGAAAVVLAAPPRVAAAPSADAVRMRPTHDEQPQGLAGLLVAAERVGDGTVHVHRFHAADEATGTRTDFAYEVEHHPHILKLDDVQWDGGLSRPVIAAEECDTGDKVVLRCSHAGAARNITAAVSAQPSGQFLLSGGA